jgi:hypothetical protein
VAALIRLESSLNFDVSIGGGGVEVSMMGVERSGCLGFGGGGGGGGGGVSLSDCWWKRLC